MMKKFTIVLITVLSINLNIAQTKILFLGNSFTYTYDIPNIFEGLANDAGISVFIDERTTAGIAVYDQPSQGLQGHINDNVSQNKILSQQWDYVVVQDNMGQWVFNYITASAGNANVILANQIKSNNSCTHIIYMSAWGPEGGVPSLGYPNESTLSCINRIHDNLVNYNTSTSTYDEIVSPVGKSWAQSLTQLPNVDLYHSDNVHPSLAGSYLAASTLFATIFKKDPSSLTYTAGVNSSTAGSMRSIAWNQVMNSTLFSSTNLLGHTPGITSSGNLLTTTGFSAPYQWYLNGIAIPGATAVNYTATVDGVYSVKASDDQSCFDYSLDLSISVPSQVTHVATTQDATCGSANGSVSVVASGGIAPYTYSLNGGTAQSSGTFIGLLAGTYSIVAFDANNNTSTTSIETISGTGAPVVNVAFSNETCMTSNGTINVTATGGGAPLNYSIDGGVTFQTNPSFNGLSAGSYSVVVSDVTGCQSNTTTIITNTGGFTLNTSADQTICNGNSANIIASGAGVGASYVWNNGLPATASNNVTPSITTVYSVTATDALSCTQTAFITVTVETIPIVNVTLSNSSVCAGEQVALVASGAQSYVWNNGSISSNLTDTPNSQTTYTVIGQNGSCSSTPVQTTVFVAPSPSVIATSDVYNIPVGGTINFSNVGSSATNFMWMFGDGNSSTQGMVSNSYSVPGVYTAVLTGAIGNCTASDTIVINVGVVGIQTNILEDAINLYPNPNKGRFNLKVDLTSGENMEVELYNTIGQIIFNTSIDDVQKTILSFDLSNEIEGIYFLRIKTNLGNVTKRIILVE